MLLHNLLIVSLVVASIRTWYQLIHGTHTFLALSGAACVKDTGIGCVLLVFHWTVWVAYLNLLNRLSVWLDHTSLANLVIIIVILHLILVHVGSLGLLFHLLILQPLYIGILDNYLFILLFDNTLMAFYILLLLWSLTLHGLVMARS